MSGILSSLGITYNSNTLKVKLKMCVSRMTMLTNKLNNQLIIEKKQIANLLNDNKDESARIRVESIIHTRNLINVFELLSLMCELLSTRIGLISSSDTCSSDLEESIASIIYCSRRVDNIPELSECTDQFSKKYGSKFVQQHINNEAGRVNPRIVDKLSVSPPDFEIVLNNMQEIAKQFDINWEPNLTLIGNSSSDDIYRLGSVAPVNSHNNQQQQQATTQNVYVAPQSLTHNPMQQSNNNSAQSQQQPLNNQSLSPQPPTNPQSLPSYNNLNKQSDTTGLYPGFLSIYIHTASNVKPSQGLKLAGVIIRILQLNNEYEWRSDTRFGDSNTNNFTWPNMLAQFTVQNPNEQLQIEIRGVVKDTLIGSTVINADTLRRSNDRSQYSLYDPNSNTLSNVTATITISTEYSSSPHNSRNNSPFQHSMPQHQHNHSVSSIPGGLDINNNDVAPPGYQSDNNDNTNTSTTDELAARLKKLGR